MPCSFHFFPGIFSDATGLYPGPGNWKRCRFLNINKLIYHVQRIEVLLVDNAFFPHGLQEVGSISGLEQRFVAKDTMSPTQRLRYFLQHTNRMHNWPTASWSEDEIHCHPTVTVRFPNLKWHTSRPEGQTGWNIMPLQHLSTWSTTCFHKMPPRNSIWKNIIPNLSFCIESWLWCPGLNVLYTWDPSNRFSCKWYSSRFVAATDKLYYFLKLLIQHVTIFNSSSNAAFPKYINYNRKYWKMFFFMKLLYECKATQHLKQDSHLPNLY